MEEGEEVVEEELALSPPAEDPQRGEAEGLRRGEGPCGHYLNLLL